MDDQNNNQQNGQTQSDYEKNVEMDQEALEDFAESLIKEKKSPYVNDSNYEDVKKQILVDVTEAINNKLVSFLNDNDIDELNALLDKNVTDYELSQFFKNKIPNLDQALAQVLLDFRQGYLSVVTNPEVPSLSPAPVVSEEPS